MTQLAEPTILKLGGHHPLDERDRALIARLAANAIAYPSGRTLVESAADKPSLLVILSGWAVRTRDLPDGRRQIYSFLLPGDVAAFRATPKGWSTTMISALTPVRVIDVAGVCHLEDGSSLARACAGSLAAEQALIFDQVVRLGQRDAYGRAIDLLRELSGRLALADPSVGQTALLPVTQDHLAEALGVTPVHVRRVVQRMKMRGVLAPRQAHGLALAMERLREEHAEVCA